jgi:hypothetical protein
VTSEYSTISCCLDGFAADLLRPGPRFQHLLRRMNFPPQGRSWPLGSPFFLGPSPMQFRSVHTQLRNRLPFMAAREHSASDHLSRIVPVKRPARPVPFHPANHGLADKETASHDEQKP